MPRIPRFAPAGLPLHVTQRGNFRQDVFFSDADRHFYLALLDRHSAERAVKIIAYCLMTNHVHLLVEPTTADGLSIMMQSLQSEYARVVNTRHEQRGHLWKTRFDSCVMDEFHLGIALAYVEMNPARAGITTTATAYEWSSARAHTGLANPPALLDMASFTSRFSKEDWGGNRANHMGWTPKVRQRKIVTSRKERKSDVRAASRTKTETSATPAQPGVQDGGGAADAGRRV